MLLTILLTSIIYVDGMGEKYLDRCMLSMNHKSTPGPESNIFKSLHCRGWNDHACCTAETVAEIHEHGGYQSYGMVLDQCPGFGNMSAKCRKHFERNNCFYECSPNLGPWIVADTVSKKTRRERIERVPLCASDCDQWYDDCAFDYTCNDDWSRGWLWQNNGLPHMCPKTCKQFRTYFNKPQKFCEQIFGGSFKYEVDGKKCMHFSPLQGDNVEVARLAAVEREQKENNAIVLHPSLLVAFSLNFLYLIK